ncbi:MAG: VOC family protein [Pseudorhodoplanes sp.]|jgi:predicted 3-demethylubiquinone-9 3-methyltransferase (glyoxalase superfamily)|nr:VOC family protein [Pseudorhodoplanes sp.]
MPINSRKITPCLWFDNQAEDAAKFYVSIFKNSKIKRVSRYSKAGHDIHKRPAGSAMTVEFELDGQSFTALNGGPIFTFDEAISFQIPCETQEEIDYYWSRLTADGGSEGPCGWVKDKFGLSWQVVPTALADMLMDHNSEKTERVTAAFLQMKKFDIAKLKRVYAGEAAAA